MRSIWTGLTALTLAFALSGNATADLVVNGGFETGDFTGWTQFGATDNTGVAGTFGGTGGVAPYEGNYQAFFGQTGDPGGISQDLTTVVGATYHISFALANLGSPANYFRAHFGTTLLYGLDDSDPFAYGVHTFDVVATSTTTTLKFTFRQVPSYFLLDAVHVVPEPSTLAMAGTALALGGLAALRRRRGAV